MQTKTNPHTYAKKRQKKFLKSLRKNWPLWEISLICSLILTLAILNTYLFLHDKSEWNLIQKATVGLCP